MFRYLPEPASEIAPKIDWIHNLITDLSVFFTVLIVGAAIYFVIRYRKKGDEDHETPQIHGNHTLELIWTIVPSVICVYIAYFGVVYYKEIRTVPSDAMTIQVTGKKWSWDFEYENGKKTAKEFTVPVNQPVKLVMTSRDVIHGFFIPAMRVKSDVVPGRFTYISFKPVKIGTYQVFCTEYCGDEHYNMLAKLNVVSEVEYDLWLNDKSDELAAARMSPVDLGRKLYKEKGCNSCHRLQNSAANPIIGPSFEKIYGSQRELTDGTQVAADDNYIRESILNPNKQIVKGYTANVMPAQEGLIDDDQIKALIAFMKTLDGSQPVEEESSEADAEPEDLSALSPAERGERLYQQRACIGCHSMDGTKLVGPSFKGLYGRKGKLVDGSEYTADDAYIKESIFNPANQVVEGYQPSMPSYQGQLNDDDISDLVEFIKTLK